MSIKTYNDIDFDSTKIIENFARRSLRTGAGAGVGAGAGAGAEAGASNVRRQFTEVAFIDQPNANKLDIKVDNDAFKNYQNLLKRGDGGDFSKDTIFKSIDADLKKLDNLPDSSIKSNKIKKLKDLKDKINKDGVDKILGEFESTLFDDVAKRVDYKGTYFGFAKKKKFGIITVYLPNKNKLYNKTLNFKQLYKAQAQGAGIDEATNIANFRDLMKKANNFQAALKTVEGQMKETRELLNGLNKANKKFYGDVIFYSVIAVLLTVGVDYLVNNVYSSNTEEFTQNNSPSPADELSEGEKTLKNIKADIDDTLMRMQVSINNKNLEKDQIKFEKELMAKLEYHEGNSEFTIKEILDYMNIPTDFYQDTLEKVVIMNSITSNDEIEEQEKLKTKLIAREMFSRFDDEEKEKFLNASQEDQYTLIETFIGDTEMKEDKENSENTETETTEKKPVVTNEIVEKTFLQKYMIVIIIGVIVLVGLLIFLMS